MLWGVVVLVPLLVGVALAAFAWPAARLAPRELPVGVVAPGAAGAAVEQRLARDCDAVEVHRFADRAAAQAAIADRDVYGAIVVGPEGTTVLTASAASPLVAQLLQQAAATGGGAAAPVRVVDVVAADPDDPRGVALAASVLPLVLAGMAAGLLVWLAGGSWPARWAAVAGRAGAALGALLMVLVGNPLSGVSSAPELLPAPAGTIGQLLPPGAGGTLLRGTAFFDGAGAAAPLAVLAAWVLLGLALTWVAAPRRPRPSPVGAREGDPVAVA